ncbi:MAG: hypothetical protein RIR70_2193 [Pseudomonadota bacterium]|jgi:hypothetical protein
MMKLRACLALLAFFCTPAIAQHHAPRGELAISAAADREGRLWVVFAKAGQLWLAHTAGGAESISAPIMVTDTPDKITAHGENRPKIAISKQGVMLITWTVASTKAYAGHVMFTRSTDGGKHFEKPRRINEDDRDISHRFDNLIIDGAGRVHVVWVDRRDVEDAKARLEERAGASIYHAYSDDDGATWSPNQRLAESSCECCRIALSLDAKGEVQALWRHVFPGGIRDHAMLSPGAKGTPLRATFSDWQINACPHQGPTLAIDANNNRHLAWFAGGADAGLYYSRLDANGMPLGAALRLTEHGANPAIVVKGAKVAVLWTRFDGSAHQLELAHSHDAGSTWHAPTPIAASAGAVDYPQWVMQQDRLHALWRTADEGIRLIDRVQP